MEADKARMNPVFPFNFCVPASSPSSVFPPMFQPGNAMMYSFLQQQLLQQLVQQQQQHSPNIPHDASPSLSDRASSRGESPSTRKLQVDENGCPICPICCEKIAESEFVAHVEGEKQKLLSVIKGVKVAKEAGNAVVDQNRKKREMELNRIKSNQMKRISLKRGPAVFRDSLTPFSRQSNDETGSSGSPEVKKENDSFDGIKCSNCFKTCEYAIVTANFNHPVCQDCFDTERSPPTMAPNIPNSIASLMNLTFPMKRSPSPSTSSSPPEKKLRID